MDHQLPGQTLADMRGGRVTGWTFAANQVTGGPHNWRTLAIMHIAMHDALNAARPRYARIMAGDLPEVGDADPLLAMAAAAYRVLLERHGEQAPLFADPLFRHAVAQTPPGSSLAAAQALGDAVGRMAVERYRPVGQTPMLFPASDQPGLWRPTPPFGYSVVSENRGFLFTDLSVPRGPAPPGLGSAAFVAAAREVQRLGGARSTDRTPDQTEAARFWNLQNSQRGFLFLASRLIAERPMPGGVWAEARAMALLSMALADSYIVAWDMKRHYSFWRPYTAITEGGGGVEADPAWEPLLITPPHPDYPSGHAADCGTGAHLMQALFPDHPGPVRYVAVPDPAQPAREFPSFQAAAEECANSRLWAGVHFRFANDEGLRLGRSIAEAALRAVPAR